jgi:hypothetical protein
MLLSASQNIISDSSTVTSGVSDPTVHKHVDFLTLTIFSVHLCLKNKSVARERNEE